MKRPLSLLEVVIGFALTAILLTALFSCFRQLMQTNAFVEKEWQKRHWEYVTQMRLNFIFSGIHPGTLFMTEPYEDISDHAVHFLFNNGVDPDPNFCQEVKGILCFNRDKEFCLFIEPRLGDKRKEVFLKNVKAYSLKFLDSKEGEWFTEWDYDYLPSMIRIYVGEKEFSFILPHAKKMAIYS